MQKIKFIATLLLTWLFVVQSIAQYQLTDAIPLDPDVKIGKLANGLTYYIRTNKKPEKKVELRLAVNAGSVLENNDQQGLAHFMEHMGFNGSKHFPKNELVDFLQKSGVKFGSDLNAYTSFDETVYILPIPTEDPGMLEKGFTVLEDWAFNNLFDPKEIDKERGVVLEESRLSKGAYERMSRQYYPKLFNGSKYAERLPIGKDEVLRSFKPESLKNFYKTWYRPNNVAVIVVGDISQDEAEKMIVKHFAAYKNPANPLPRPAIIPIKTRVTPEAMVLTDEEATNTIVQIYNFVKPAPKQKTWANYKKNLLEGLVSNLINQRLTELTQAENPPFLYGYTGFGQFLRGYNSFNSFAVVSKGTAQQAVDALMQETNRAREFGFLQTELDRAKATMINGAQKALLEKDKSESNTFVYQYVNNFLSGNPMPGVQHRYNFLKAILPAISLKEVNEVAASMPAASNAFALIQAPAALKKDLPDNKQFLNGLIAASQIPVTAYTENATIASLMDKLPVPGKVVTESKNEKLGTTDFTLNNGVTICMKPTNFKNDDIRMDAWRWGGFRQYPLADKENAKNAAILVRQMGVSNFSPTDLRKFASGKTFSVSPYINQDENGIEGSSSVKDFESFLQLVHLYYMAPRKDQKLFNSFINNQKGDIQFLSKDPRVAFQDTVQKIAYQNNPWLESIPKAEDYDHINLDRSLEIYRDIFSNADGLHFTFVGNIDPVAAKPLLEKYLGSLPASKTEHMYNDVGLRIRQGATDISLKLGKEKQAYVRMIFEGETAYTRENKLQLAALLEVLNIEIIEKLREEMSGVYGAGIYGSVVHRPYPHYTITAGIPCGPENVEKLTNALTGLIQKAQDSGVDQKNLDKVKETWKKQYHVNLQNNGYWLNSLSNAFINKDDPEDILNYEQLIGSITVQDLQKIARKYLTLDNRVKAVMYPEGTDVKEEIKTSK